MMIVRVRYVAALVGRESPQLLAVDLDALERLDVLAQKHLGAVLQPLLDHAVDVLLAVDLREPGDVEDVLLGIHRRDLAAELLEALDDAAARLAVAGVVRGGEAGGPAPMIVTSTTGCALIAGRLVDSGLPAARYRRRAGYRHHARTSTRRSAPLHVPEPLIIATAVLLVGSIAASFVDRLGAPTLLVFLGLGMLLGEDGPGGIQFDDATLARDAGTVALMIILIEGGLLAERSEVRRALGPAGLLATLGVLVTAGIVALAAHRRRSTSTGRRSLLLGAAVSSTDAAAVFASLRGTDVRRRLASILEAESGLNDPFAALLVIGLVEWSTTERTSGSRDGLLLLVQQAGIGAAGGLAVGVRRRLAAAPPAAALRRPHAGDHGRDRARPEPSASRALDGSGLLAAYLIGLVIGDARIPHAAVVRGFLQGSAWLAQLGLFVLLGLLVTPSRMLDEGLAPIFVAVALVLVARPLAVLLCTTPFGLSVREQAFLAWAGLRGGVPIVLATFPIAAGVPGALRVFDAVFFVVVISVAAQGLTMRWAANQLDLVDAHPVPRLAEIDSATLSTLHSELVELRAPTSASGPARSCATRSCRARRSSSRSAGTTRSCGRAARAHSTATTTSTCWSRASA